ncbi:MAG: hypothetical protein V4510_10760 [bacterium]
METRVVSKISLAAALVALLVLPVVDGLSGGGNVNNKDPTVETFTTTAASFNNPTTAVFTGTIKDRNKEGDLITLKVATVSGPATIAQTYTIQSADRSATTEPGSFSGLPGFKVWNDSSGGFTTSDGVLQFKFQYSFSVSGTYVIRASAQDEGASFFSAPAADLTVTIVDKITVAADPVDAAGVAQTSAAWGAWSADPGAANVASANYVKVTNSGITAAQQFTIDLPAAFSGGGDSISVDNNVQFACTEGTSAQAPSALAFTFGTTSATGSVSPTFTATGKVIYCTYKLLALPDPLTDATYSGSFTTIAA